MMGICTWLAKLAKGSQAAVLKKEAEEDDNIYIGLKSETGRLPTEYTDLPYENNPLYELIEDIAKYCKKEFDKMIMITMIYRTQEEQESIYGEGYTKKSPHQFWHGVDLRSRDFTEEEIKQLVDYINEKYNETNYYKFTAKCHEVGNHGMHFHIQYLKDK